jgi:ribose transport system ATP-binding protein
VTGRTGGGPAPIVRLRGISKHFGATASTSTFSPGAVHAIAGENGAGKSTLMKLLSQAERPDGGTVEIAGGRVRFHGPRHAQRLGVAMVHQEFALAPHLSIAENLVLGHETTRLGLIPRGWEKRRAR